MRAAYRWPRHAQMPGSMSADENFAAIAWHEPFFWWQRSLIWTAQDCLNIGRQRRRSTLAPDVRVLAGSAILQVWRQCGNRGLARFHSCNGQRVTLNSRFRGNFARQRARSGSRPRVSLAAMHTFAGRAAATSRTMRHNGRRFRGASKGQISFHLGVGSIVTCKRKRVSR